MLSNDVEVARTVPGLKPDNFLLQDLCLPQKFYVGVNVGVIVGVTVVVTLFFVLMVLAMLIPL